MWNERKPRRDKSGKRWNFLVWHDVWTEDRVVLAARLFFWDDNKTECGVVLYPVDATEHFSRLKPMIEKLVADPEVRKQYRRDLRFPLERYYAEYGSFPEE